ncbi:hypothetical protein FE782_02125 [Paenibacillus antri]|uniref:Heparinase n=1 Tax=Paenibacillus antri TaxID=2582848 RepID=A0A5R9GPF3_9BACL|nr:hypothetical protein [Paenibacillus antri]TLS54165.1 hypothetical protein FE782_02125 [Paenibacillus antri]
MNEHDLLLRELERQEAAYNAAMRAVTEPFTSPGYHTTLTEDIGEVHRTRTAAYYALALLDGGLPQHRERAFEVLTRLVEAQDTNPENKTFGIWSWFYEEPLTQMAPPDWNWADFIGKPLLLTLKRHSGTLPEALRGSIEQAVRNACQAIIRRNVGPHYTNIAIMGAFVTLCAGEWLGDADVEAYGLARLQRFYDYTMESGTFQEFNSPTYTTVAIEELSSILTETGSPVARRLAEELLDVAWAIVAERFHPRTGQWSGPHARAYSELLQPHVLSFLQHALEGRVTWLPEEAFHYHTMWYGNRIRCPDKFVSRFVEPRTSSLVQPLLVDAGGKQRYAVTYATEDYSLATVSHGDLWNQRRSLLAYAATPSGPVYVHLRALHDGYDYTGAWLLAAQRDGRALFAVHFATDGGDRHPNLHLIRDGTIRAKDLRLRFEIGGAIESVEADWLPRDGALPRCVGRIGELPITVDLGAAAFGGHAIRYEIARENGTIGVDVILYEGEAQDIRLAALERAIVAGQFALGASTAPYVAATDGETCTLEADGMRIAAPVRPAPIRELTERSIAATGQTEVTP